ncbi:MAG: diacylglycerol kinase family protein [Massiliimalia sp.]|jgi:diacylglycerol kinase (ATP)
MKHGFTQRKRVVKKAVRYKKEIDSLGRSFLYAIHGFLFAVNNERNMRIHLSAAVFVTEFALVYGLSGVKLAVLLVLFGLVISAEMVNTAVEALVNLQTGGYDHLARIAKDVAAGAVLVLALVATAVGGIFFLHWDRLIAVWEYLCARPWAFVVLAVEAAAALFFIFGWNRRNSPRF